MTDEPEIDPGLHPWYVASRRVALVAAAFCVLVMLLLGFNAIAARSTDPLQTLELETLLHRLNRTPTDPALKAQARRLDLQMRRAYFTRRTFAARGFFLLLGGILTFMAATAAARRLRPVTPVPNPSAAADQWAAVVESRQSVLILGGLLGGVLLLLAVLSRHDSAAEYARYALKEGRPPILPTAPPPAVVASNSGSTAPAQSALAAPGLAAPPAGGGALAPPAGGTSLAPLPVPAPGPTTAPAAPTSAPKAAPHAASPATPAAASGAVMPAAPAEWAKQWPAFRGPAMAGLAYVADAPTRWSPASGVLWKAPIPLPGNNSPIVWGPSVFLAGADAKNREIYCFDAATGKLKWKRAVPIAPGTPEVRISPDTGYAPSTMATDGERLCAIFPTGDVVGLDFSGRIVWSRSLGAPDNNYGHASSLAIYGGGLIVQYDQGSDPSEGKSVLYALSLKDGSIVWQVKRPTPASWATPLIVRAGGRDLIVTCANPLVIAHDARTGAEVWRAECLGGEVAPSPTFGGGYVFAANMSGYLAAIRPDGTGDITKTGVVWQYQDDLPDIVSPLGTADLVYIVATMGMVTAVDAKTGKKVWSHRYAGEFHSSPILVGRRIYLTDKKGVTHIFEAGRTFKDLGQASIGEDVNATPAFVGGRIYMRGKQHLFCIGAKR